MKTSLTAVSFSFSIVASLTAIFTFFLIVIGALVRVSGSGLGCPDWPLCHGQFLPPLELHPIVEYSHRLTATLVMLFTALTTLWAWLRYRNEKWIFRGAVLAVLLLFVQIALGGITVLAELPPTVVAIHLGNAMLLLATVLTVASCAWTSRSRTVGVATAGTHPSGNPHAPPLLKSVLGRTLLTFEGIPSPPAPAPIGERGKSRSGEGDPSLPPLTKGGIKGSYDRSLFKLIVASAVGVFIIILSGSFVEGGGAAEACKSWPLCNGGELVSPGILPAIHMLHRFIVGIAGLLALYAFYRGMKQQAHNRSIFFVALIGAVLLIVQVLVGAAQVWLQFPPLVEGAHVAFASAVWGSLVVMAILVRPAETVRVTDSQVREEPRSKSTPFRVADFFALTKPWIVALLLTTTLAGMLVAARGLPPINILLLTLLGGACAAGGANALNSYIDRDVDKIMGRTSRRPLPSGRVSPRGALIFALALSSLSPLILGIGVNWLSAALALLGIAYYAGLYTLVLKRATPQNIVVGGAAGAIPPLVGWAAVSNDLSLLALYLFAIILLWTPPHTWALMLLLDKDYHRAKIPMLPAAWGQVEARRQIILYSILLFVTTIVPFSFGALGLIYLIGAVLLGAYFLMLALRLWRNGASYKPIARKLYHFSNAYLALLFLSMVVDHWLPTWRVF